MKKRYWSFFFFAFLVLSWSGGKSCHSEESFNLDKPQKFGILISGKTEERHEENLSLAYQVLLKNGFKEENIYILDENGRDTPNYPVDGLASKKLIARIFQIIAKRSGSKAILVFYATSHGNKKTKETIKGGKKTQEEVSFLLLGEKQNLDESELSAMLADVKFEVGIFMFDQCNGGGFAKRLAGNGRITISASKKEEKSKGNTFPQAFFSAFLHKELADTNGDGEISVQEAFDFACQNDENRSRQNPQFHDGIYKQVFL